MQDILWIFAKFYTEKKANLTLTAMRDPRYFRRQLCKFLNKIQLLAPIK